MTRTPLFSVTKKDFEIQTFRAGGNGGQNQNKRDTGVRLIHHESRVRAESREARTQAENKRLAFNKIVNDRKFKAWLAYKASILEGAETVEAAVNRQMHPDNLLIETLVDNKWVPVND